MKDTSTSPQFTVGYGTDGFPEHPMLGKVATRLNERKPSLDAFVQHTGGGEMTVQVKCNGGYVYYSPADDYWSWSLYDSNDEYERFGMTAVPSDSDDVDAIVDACLHAASEAWSRGLE